MLTGSAPNLLHVVGFLTGAALYAMLLVMVVRSVRTDRLALATAILGLIWNIGQLLASGAQGVNLVGITSWLAATSFGALGFLAAVVVHSVCRSPSTRQSGKAARLVVAFAYSSAGLAALLHFMGAAAQRPQPSSAGLTLLTGGLAALVLPLVLLTRRQDNRGRALWMVALAVFAVSALHLSRFHGSSQESWPVEVLGHHASISLAFVILYQDYRFAFADLFLKQALALIALVAIVFASYATLEPLLHLGSGTPHPMAVSALLALWVATALVFPSVRRGIGHFVDLVVLGRRDYDELAAIVSAEVEQHDSVDAVLTWACGRLAPALTAESVTWVDRNHRPVSGTPPHEVSIVTAEQPYFALRIGPLAGGRRLLSDDLSMLERVSVILARRIDALRLTGERYERMLREREIRSLATEAELRALRAQINPHFLFNALTTIGYLIQHAPAKALQTLMRLTTLLRSVLRSEGEFTTLGREAELIDCYLQIEAARFEERLRVTIEIPHELWDIPIPAVIVQPVVENAIKHGIAKSLVGGAIRVTAALDGAANRLKILVRNTGAPFDGRKPEGSTGVGLLNVERRLQCYFGQDASMVLRQDVDGATVVELTMPGALEEDRNVTLVTKGAAS